MSEKPATVRVLLHVGRTGYGRRGQVVDYPEADAQRHQAEGRLTILTAEQEAQLAANASLDAALAPAEEPPAERPKKRPPAAAPKRPSPKKKG